MSNEPVRKIAIVSPGDRALRDSATGDEGRFTQLFAALRSAGHQVEPAIYHDDFCDEVAAQLAAVDVVLVWVNPVHEGRTRAALDDMLRAVAEQGVVVSAHPDAILALGTKRVLYDTRHMGWGCHTELYQSFDELVSGLTASLALGPRVLKQHRGSSGAGVWSVQVANELAQPITRSTPVRVRHAKRGSTDEVHRLDEFCELMAVHLVDGGLVVDQEFQTRIAEGMVRCYLVRDRVAGFGHQATNALIPATPGSDAPAPGPRLYHPPSMAEYQYLKELLESEWVPALEAAVGLPRDRLPILWDCDFLLGPVDESGHDTYVLCEINVSSVAPYPESADQFIVQAVSQA